MKELAQLIRTRTHPLTGDALRPSEVLSFVIQGLMRRWSFVAAYTVFSFVWWAHPLWFHDPDLSSWNRWASLAALWIESVVGIGLFGQTLRDAVHTRRTERLAEQIARTEERTAQILERLEALIEQEAENL